jgi:hypothetical protein
MVTDDATWQSTELFRTVMPVAHVPAFGCFSGSLEEAGSLANRKMKEIS